MPNAHRTRPAAATAPAPRASERGFVAMVLLLGVVTAVLALSVGLVSVDTRPGLGARVVEFARERARDAAENALDDALFAAQRPAGLAGGVSTTRDLRDGRSYTWTTALLRGNGVDDDGDGAVDELDEDLLRATATGACDGQTVVLQAQLAPDLPGGALVLHGATTTIDLQDTALVDGRDHVRTGAPGDAAADTAGIAIATPHDAALLATLVPAGDHARVAGAGGAPSLAGRGLATDFAEQRARAQAAAPTTLAGGTVVGASLGDAALGARQVTIVAGDVRFEGTTRGAGVLFVAGDLVARGVFAFDGLVLVQGALDLGDATTVHGSVVVARGAGAIVLGGATQLRWSRTELDAALGLLGPRRYGHCRGWRQLAP